MNKMRILFSLLCIAFLTLLEYQAQAQSFSATGYSRLEDIPPNDWGGSEITFDKVPGAKLVIDGLGHALWQPSDVRVNFGYLETYDPDRADDDVLISWETIGDLTEKIYNRVWVESENPARIKVMFIGGLIYLENNDTYGRRIAHSSHWSGSPWGPQYLDSHPDPEATGWGYGDWAEEVYYIYPDGTHTRYAKAYSAFAHLAKAFDSTRRPEEGDYQFEFMEAAFQIPEGKQPNTTVEPNNSLLLADMNESSTRISYEPVNPGLSNVRNGFSPLRYGNMMAVNMVGSPHNPFVIGLPSNSEMRPYECFTNDQDCSSFYIWGVPCTYGCISPLGHLVNWTQFEKQRANQATNTPGFVSNVYLQGWINEATTGTEFSRLGKSWITPASMRIASGGYSGGNYEIRERAYKVTRTTGTDFVCTLRGSRANPVRNPAIVIENWGTANANVSVNGAPPDDVRIGYEGNDLVVWLEHASESNVNIIISPSSNAQRYNLVTSTTGTGEGTIALNPAGGSYERGSSVTLTAIPNNVSTFNEWGGAATGASNPLVITMDGNKNISADFTACTTESWTQINDDDPSISYSGNWTSVPAPNGYENDAHFTESSGATLTYSFTGTRVRLYLWIEQFAQAVNVSIDGSTPIPVTNPGGRAGRSVRVFESPVLSNGNHTLSLSHVSGEVHVDGFEYLGSCEGGDGAGDQIPLTTCVNGRGSIILNPNSELYEEGSTVTARAIPAAGWKFDKWSGEASGTTNPLSIRVKKKRIACVGNSITEGATLADPVSESYPAQLQGLLGDAYEVLNFGYSGATVSNNTDIPYTSQQIYTDALASSPDIVTIMLGTNDTYDWANRGLDFQSSLTSLVQSFLDLPTRPKVLLAYSPSMQREALQAREEILSNEIIPIIDAVAITMGLEVIDVHTPTVNQPNWFPDNVHPNRAGSVAIARVFYNALRNTSCLTANFSRAFPPPPSSNNNLAAYYTRTSFNEYTEQISDEYADVVVKLEELGDLVFSREYSFRPNWIYSGGSQRVNHLATIDGDGNTDGNFDARCRYAYARIIKNDPSEVIVHWRYFPDLDQLDPTDVVHELYFIKSDGTVRREYKAGTATIDEWLDVNNKTTQTFNLTASGISNIQTTTGSFTPPTIISGNPILGSVAGSPLAHWKLDEAQGNSTAPNGIISGHKSLWKKGVSGTALGFDGYFSQVSVPTAQAPTLGSSFTIDTWVVMGAFPFGDAPIVHHSSNTGQEGYYLGVNSGGQAIFIVNGTQATSTTSLPLNKWVHIVGTYGNGSMQIYIDGVESASEAASGSPNKPSNDLLIGLNNQNASPTDPVYDPQTYPSIFGFEGLIDEVVIYNSKLGQAQINQNFNRLNSAAIKDNPDIDERVLPGQAGVASTFGATHSRLSYHDLWDNMWRVSEFEDVTIKFDSLPTNYVYWRGTTHGVNMVTENNLWMSDQSEEIFCGDLGFPSNPSGNPSLSEHMSDKEARYSHIRVIENTPARVVVHWRYAVADLFYDQCDERNFVDEYHTIYPDGTLFRNLNFWSVTGDSRTKVGSDIQPLTSPGLLPEDIVNTSALTIGNVNGSSKDLTWTNGVPEGEEGEILMANFKSNWKIYEALPAGFTAGPWGATNQSAQSTAQYAGPWNHWPVSRIVSDGRQAWDGDGRVNHFALSTGGGSSVVMYGFSNQNSTSTQDITTVFPAVNAWRESPPVSSISDGTSQGYNMDQREYNLTRSGRNLSVTLAGSSSTPIANPCFVIKNWNSNNAATLRINRIPTTNFRQGIIYDTDGTQTLIIYVPMQSTSSTNFVIGRRQIIIRTDQEVYTEAETSEICNVDIIRSTATVGAGANLTYSARQEIILENGFTASKDCVFVAQIGNCQGPQPEILVETRATEAILLDRDIDAHEVSVFPIPASTHLNYNVKEMEAVEVIYLFDMLGRLVREERNLNGRINIADLPNGQYALVFVINGQRVHRLVQKM